MMKTSLFPDPQVGTVLLGPLPWDPYAHVCDVSLWNSTQRKTNMDMEEHWPLYFKTLFEMILQVIMMDHGYTFGGSKKFSFFSFS